MSSQTLCIGDLRLSFRDCPFELTRPHCDFIREVSQQEKTDLELDLEVGKRPSEFLLDAKSELIFDSGGVWRLLKTQDCDLSQQVIEVFNQHDSKEIPYFRARFNLDEKKGQLEVCENAYGLGKEIHPFQYPLDQLLWIQLLAKNNGFILHSFAFVHEDRAYCFAGVSGAGKTTLAKLFRKRYPNATILSDDRVIVRKKGNEFFAYGTPWHGDGVEWSSASAKLERIFILEHGETNHLKLLDPVEAFSALFNRSFPTLYSAPGMENTLDVFLELVEMIHVSQLSFVPDAHIFPFLAEVVSFGKEPNGRD